MKLKASWQKKKKKTTLNTMELPIEDCKAF